MADMRGPEVSTAYTLAHDAGCPHLRSGPGRVAEIWTPAATVSAAPSTGYDRKQRTHEKEGGGEMTAFALGKERIKIDVGSIVKPGLNRVWPKVGSKLYPCLSSLRS